MDREVTSLAAIASHPFANLSRKLRRNLEDYGWPRTAKRVVAHLAKVFYFQQVYRIYRITLDPDARDERFAESEFSFMTLSAQDAKTIAAIEEIAEWLRGRLRQKIASGQLCLVATTDDGRVAGFNLINFGEWLLDPINLRRKVRKGSAWSEHIAVTKPFRRRSVGSQLRCKVFDELRERRIRRLYGGTPRSNKASLRLASAVGFKEISDIHYRKILWFESWRFKRVPKRR
jgi:GNAT superfamily N-acetyltransferase